MRQAGFRRASGIYESLSASEAAGASRTLLHPKHRNLHSPLVSAQCLTSPSGRLGCSSLTLTHPLQFPAHRSAPPLKPTCLTLLPLPFLPPSPAAISPAGPKTFVDIGCNKGYTSAKLLGLWAPEVGFKPQTLQSKRPEILCGTCKDCEEKVGGGEGEMWGGRLGGEGRRLQSAYIFGCMVRRGVGREGMRLHVGCLDGGMGCGRPEASFHSAVLLAAQVLLAGCEQPCSWLWQVSSVAPASKAEAALGLCIPPHPPSPSLSSSDSQLTS